MQLTHDAIARRAYELWEARGRPFGDSDRDWQAAEQELMEREISGEESPQSPDETGSVPITNLERGLSPPERRRAREARHEPEPQSERAAARRESRRFIVLMDRAHVRIYSENTGPGALGGIALQQAFDDPAGKRPYTARETDQAGRFAGVRGTPSDASVPGGSIDERLPMQEEHETRLVSALAERLEGFLEQHPDAHWNFAAPPAIHRAVLSRVSPASRDRLDVALAKDLVNQPGAAIRSHFAEARPQAAQRTGM